MTWWKRVLGAVIGGGGTFAVFYFFGAWGLPEPATWGASGLMAIAGGAFGPKIYEAVLHIF